MSNTATVITTKAGEALIAQMQAENKVLVIDKFIFANVPNRPAFPSRDDVVPTEHVVHESAVHEQGRLTENSVIYSTTLASNVGPFSFNWSGLFCSEHNVLVAINFPPPVDKTVDAPGITGNTLVRSFVLEYKGIAETTNITVDPSSWQYDAHKRMSKMDNDTAQAIIDQNGKDWFIDDGFIVTPQSSAYSIKAGAGYVSGHRISLDFDRIIQVPEKPAFIYVDAFREGSPTGEWQTKYTFVVAADEKDDYTDAQGVNHFVCKIAQVFEDGSVGDMRVNSDNASRNYVEQEQAKQTEMLIEKKRIVSRRSDIVGKVINDESAIELTDLNQLFIIIPRPSKDFVISRVDVDNRQIYFDGIADDYYLLSSGSGYGVQSNPYTQNRPLMERFDDVIKVADYVDLTGCVFNAFKLAVFYAKKIASNKKVKISFEGLNSINYTETVVIDFYCIVDFMHVNQTTELGIETALKVSSKAIIKNVSSQGKGKSDDVRFLWFNNAPGFKLIGSTISGYKEDLWIDGGSHSHSLIDVMAGQAKGRSVYVDVVTSAEATWVNVYVPLSKSYITSTATGIELFASSNKDTGGFHWYNVLVVNNFAAGARAGKGIYLNGSIAEGTCPIHWVSGGTDGFRRNEGQTGLLVRNWAQVKTTNVWASNVEIHDADNPQFIGGNCADGFLLKGRIRNPVFGFVRSLEGTHAFIIDPDANITGLQEFGTVCNSICNDMSKWLALTNKEIVTGSKAYDEAKHLRDKDSPTPQWHYRINSLGELVILDKGFLDALILKKNGMLWVKGGVAPFTGCHLYWSSTLIPKNHAVDIVNATSKVVDGQPMDGAVCESSQYASKTCIGVVSSCEQLSDGYLITVAAVGDNRVGDESGFIADMDISAGDVLCTSATNGLLTLYDGSDLAVTKFKALESRQKGQRIYGVFLS